jgi:hypothetical protein
MTTGWSDPPLRVGTALAVFFTIVGLLDEVGLRKFGRESG